jgi:hypothetical protein
MQSYIYLLLLLLVQLTMTYTDWSVMGCEVSQFATICQTTMRLPRHHNIHSHHHDNTEYYICQIFSSIRLQFMSSCKWVLNLSPKTAIQIEWDDHKTLFILTLISVTYIERRNYTIPESQYVTYATVIISYGVAGCDRDER